MNSNSSDNCTDPQNLQFLVMRMDQQDTASFRQCVQFTCADRCDTIMVILQVCDESNNCNMVMCEVEIQEKIPPVITIPGDLTIACVEDTTGLARATAI